MGKIPPGPPLKGGRKSGIPHLRHFSAKANSAARNRVLKKNPVSYIFVLIKFWV